MGKALTPETDIVETEQVLGKGLYGKLANLAKILVNADWTKDGVNAAQKYKYISEAEYKKHFGRAVLEAGLVFNFEVIEREFVQNITANQHLVSIKALFTYTDPETMESRSFVSFGDGADMTDKGLYKAMTGAYKYHIANNFHVAENDDAEADSGQGKVGNKFFSREGAGEAKTKLMNQSGATDPQIKQLTALLKEYAKSSPDKAKAFKEANPDLTKISEAAMDTIIKNITGAVAAAKKDTK